MGYKFEHASRTESAFQDLILQYKLDCPSMGRGKKRAILDHRKFFKTTYHDQQARRGTKDKFMDWGEFCRFFTEEKGFDTMEAAQMWKELADTATEFDDLGRKGQERRYPVPVEKYILRENVHGIKSGSELSSKLAKKRKHEDDSTKKNDATKTSAPAKVTSPGAPAQAKESGEEQAAPAAEPNATPEKKQPATNGLNKSESSTDPQGGQSPAEKVETPQATPTPPAPGPISALEPNKIPEAKNIETGEKLQQTSASLATPMPQQQQPGDSQVFAMNQQPSGQGAGNRSGAPEKLRDPTNPGNVEPEDAKSRYKDLFGIG